MHQGSGAASLTDMEIEGDVRQEANVGPDLN